MKSKRLGNGFTIVELLIVVVVIAILAAITIVAYNGIQQRAKSSAVQSAASQAGKKMLAYGLQNSDLYPADADFTTLRGSIGLPDESAALTYSYYASDDRKSFCLSTTDTTVSPNKSYAMTQSGSVVEGRCVKNLFTNPSFESVVSPWSASLSVPTLSSVWSISGTQSIKVSPSSTSADTFAAVTIGVGAGVIDQNETYRVSGTFYQAGPQTGAIDGRGRKIVGYSFVNSTPASLGESTAASNVSSSTRQSFPFTVTQSGATTITLRLYNGATNSADNSVYWDGIMLTKGSSLYSYGDGSVPNWAWTGAAHASASFGPATLQ